MLIHSYKFGSGSAKVLSQALGAKRIKHEGSKFKGRQGKTVINWGCSKLPQEVMKCTLINQPDNVKLASNKLLAFNLLKGQAVSVPPFTTEREEAVAMIEDGKVVVCRTILNGNSGEGIVIAETVDQLVDSPLYVQYVPKKEEYRVHVVNGQVIHSQRKARKRDVPDDQVNWKVRNLAGGFIFAINEDHTPPQLILDQAVLAVNSLGLDFGAVDVIWNEKTFMPYVLEVNTAPGLAGTTLDKYVEAFEDGFQ